MSKTERNMMEQMVMAAGWKNDGGWWKHANVGGLHNLRSAIRITDGWCE